jgi:hypothetical protein
MGGLKLTTGLYEENFFGNPGRVTANQKFRFTVFDASGEINTHAISNTSNITGSNPAVGLAQSAGQNNHARVETTFPAIYFPGDDIGSFYWAFAFITSSQADVDARRSYNLDPTAIADVSFAADFGRRFLDDGALGVGLTTQLSYRISTIQNFNLANLLTTASAFTLQNATGDGLMLDFGIGATYNLPYQWGDWQPNVALAINNLLGGGFSNLGVNPLHRGGPYPQPRALGTGLNIRRPTWGAWDLCQFGLEFQDIANNPDGSFFRTVHIGGEAHYGLLALRAGIYQGYWGAGFGLDFKMLTFDFATYGEEMTLNIGGIEDRRLAIRIALQL